MNQNPMKRNLTLKKNLRAGQVCFGTWLTFPDPMIAEVIAGVGFDWVIIDTEHSPFNPETLAHMLMAFNGSQTVPFIRVGSTDHMQIKLALDMGAGGVLVPWVTTEEDARRVVAACRYPPEGTRGFGPRRASDYYRNLEPLEEYVRISNESVFVAVQFEHIDAVRDVERILAVPGIDVALLGPMDLSGTMGLLGQLDHPKVLEAIDRVIEKAKAAGIPVGVPVEAKPDVLAGWIARGSQFATVGEDLGFLKRGASQALEECKHSIRNSGNSR
jgi:2-keto-3-deoxy-L-rhamnonate aldolase RhmA